MTLTESIEVLAVLKAAYPHSFQKMSKSDYEATVSLWARLFAADPASEVAAAVDALLATRTVGYSPTPGEVKEQMQRLRTQDELDEGAAWALVSKACSDGLYHYKEQYAKLPPEVQDAVGAPEQLREWAKLDVETVQSVVASNFQRNYRARQTRRKELEKLPPNLRPVISGLADHFMIGG